MFDSLVKITLPNPEDKRDPLQVFAETFATNQLAIMKLLPIAKIDLTADEIQRVQLFQTANLVLGSAAAAPMVCSAECPKPFQSTCPLFQIDKAPVGERCPFEQQYVSERFLGWMQELGRTLQDLLESERSAIATLAVLDLQERRCAAILADAENATLTGRSVRDVDTQTGVPIAWEDVMHANTLRMDSIQVQRRMILRDFELTPEMQTKRKKALAALEGQKHGGKDLSSRASENADKIRRALRGEIQVVDVK